MTQGIDENLERLHRERRDVVVGQESGGLRASQGMQGSRAEERFQPPSETVVPDGCCAFCSSLLRLTASLAEGSDILRKMMILLGDDL